MKHIQTIETRDLCQSAKNGGCGGGPTPPPATTPAGWMCRARWTRY